MKKNVFIKCLLIAVLSVIIIFFAGICITYFNSKNIVNERLLTETELVSSLINDADDFTALRDFKNNSGCRVTIIELDGNVIYDSDTDEMLENHLDRKEIIAAIKGESKLVERYSSTFRCNMTYYAVTKTLKDNSTVVIRLAIRSSETNTYIISSIPFLIIALIFSSAIAALFAGKLSKNVAGRIEDISASLSSINKGRYVPLETDTRDREFFTIYNEINDLNSSTVEHIRNEENERDKLGTVLNNISQGIVAIDRDFNILFINGSAISLFDSTNAVVSRNLCFLVENKQLLDKITEATKNKESRFEFELSEKHLLVEIVNPTEKSLKKEIKRIFIFTDITNEKELARQKEEFFANASHELKTPLTAMLGLSELALAQNEAPRIQKKLERIHSESQRLSGLISDMLKLSRLEESDNDEVASNISVDGIASDVINELSTAIEAKRLSVKISGSASVRADERRIYELVQNLVSNAVNYNKPNGEIEVSLSENKNCSVITVKDTGIGISEENIPHLCERFYRVDKSRSKKTGGTGLGLAIVKHICALYEAKLEISSKLDAGTEVTVTFPKLPPSDS